MVQYVEVEAWVKTRDDSMTKEGSRKDGEGDEKLRMVRKVAGKKRPAV